MSKKRDLEIHAVVVLDRKAAEKDSVADCMKTIDFALDCLSSGVKKSFKGAIEGLKKTGKLRWPPKKY